MERAEPAYRLADEVKPSREGIESEASAIARESGDQVAARSKLEPIVRALISASLLLSVEYERRRDVGKVHPISIQVDDRLVGNRLEALGLEVGRARRPHGARSK